MEIDFPDVIRNKIILAKSNGLLNDINELKTSDSVLIFRYKINLGYLICAVPSFFYVSMLLMEKASDNTESLVPV